MWAHALPIAFGFSSEGRGFGSGAIGGEGERGGGGGMEKRGGGAMLPSPKLLPVYKSDMGRNSTKMKTKYLFAYIQASF